MRLSIIRVLVSFSEDVTVYKFTGEESAVSTRKMIFIYLYNKEYKVEQQKKDILKSYQFNLKSISQVAVRS